MPFSSAVDVRQRVFPPTWQSIQLIRIQLDRHKLAFIVFSDGARSADGYVVAALRAELNRITHWKRGRQSELERSAVRCHIVVSLDETQLACFLVERILGVHSIAPIPARTRTDVAAAIALTSMGVDGACSSAFVVKR